MDRTLTERVAELAREASAERERLAAARAQLVAGREAETKAIRARHADALAADLAALGERHRAALDAIEAELGAIRALDRALAIGEAKPERRRAETRSQLKPRSKASLDVLATVLAVFRDGEARTIPGIEALVPFSAPHTRYAVYDLRDAGHLRLAGQETKPGGRVPAKLYAITPDGTAWLAEIEHLSHDNGELRTPHESAT